MEMDDGEKCSICRDPLDIDDVVELECGHFFHHTCIFGGVSDRCALCRAPSDMLMRDETLKKRKVEAKKEAVEEQIKDDREVAIRLQAEELGEEEDIEVQPIERDSEEWAAAVQTIVGWLAEMVGEEDHPLDGYEGDDKANRLHNIFHGGGAFQRISCRDLCDIAADALAHEMFSSIN